MNFKDQLDEQDRDFNRTVGDNEFELRFFLARRIWPMRDEPMEGGDGLWRDAFERRHGMSIEEYRELAYGEDHHGIIRQRHAAREQRTGVSCPCSFCAER